MAANDEVKPPREYPGNAVEGSSNGALLDLRVRLAADFLRASPAIGELQKYLCDDDGPNNKYDAKIIAEYALDMAGELLTGADRRGWIKDLPEGDALSAAERSYALRTGRYSAMQQVGGAKQMGEEQSSAVVTPAPGVFKGH
jgi:hypothetical protein